MKPAGGFPRSRSQLVITRTNRRFIPRLRLPFGLDAAGGPPPV